MLAGFTQNMNNRMNKIEGLFFGIKPNLLRLRDPCHLLPGSMGQESSYDYISQMDIESKRLDLPPWNEAAIPLNHTTAASLLLEWPGIRKLVKCHLKVAGIQKIYEYPIKLERTRAPLNTRHRDGDSYHLKTPLQKTDQALILAEMYPNEPSDSHKALNFNESKIWQLVDVFTQNILNMHPIIQPGELRRWVKEFLFLVQSKESGQPCSKTVFAQDTWVEAKDNPDEDAASRVKRQKLSMTDPAKDLHVSEKIRKSNQCINHALVLTAFALGEVCIQREYILEAPQLDGTSLRPHPVHRSAEPSSPNSIPSAQPYSRPHELEDKHSHMHNGCEIHRHSLGYIISENLSYVPGFQYFKVAMSILDDFFGVYEDVRIVYINIFASLYHGQLGRPLESFSFIHRAGKSFTPHSPS